MQIAQELYQKDYGDLDAAGRRRVGSVLGGEATNT